MKLSEAIRLGAMLRPQTFGDYRDSNGSCALGAAAEACGVDALSAFAMNEFERNFNDVFRSVCPACGLTPDVCVLTNTVIHLNDFHRWTREQIADWVETIEPQAVLVSTAEVAQAAVAVART